MDKQDILNKIKKSIDTEIESIQHFRSHIDPKFVDAVELILACKGKVVVTGVGKSGNIAKKIASTMSSTGTPSIFLHPTDAAHGDAGAIQHEDVVIAIGKSGESDELLSILPTIKKIGAKIIALTANPKSKLAAESEVVVITPILKEACPLELAPTSSTTIALVAGDAIAMTLMELKGFQEQDFALYHPSGRLGKRLSLLVEDVMRKGEQNSVVFLDTDLNGVLNEITTKLVGAVSVVDKDYRLKGFITDYDIRKLLTKNELSNTKKASEIMNSNPTSFYSDMMAYDVLLSMEGRKRPISVTPIVDKENTVVGIVSLHDLLQKGLK
ncbi:MAG: KpsF/GutQ family sugar-phosphate isomerase [Leptospiraceae bacterium]|nr:KpsF/GutQ family sugar-phosphate isomerase [Leptospiraceae bacterium]MCP5496354.1 KpsF/GutQ family sugar-phosphate isomerase [Leptospiraceae bacterium]